MSKHLESLNELTWTRAAEDREKSLGLLARVAQSSALQRRSHLLLAQDDHSSRFNWVPGGQVVPGAQTLAVLVGLPEAVPGCPGDADVVPAAVAHRQRELGHLVRGQESRG